MTVLASFNYTLSTVAAAVGVVVLVLTGYAWFRAARGWAAGFLAGVTWGGVAGLVGLAGEGDMREFTALGFGVIAFALGLAIVGGAAALLRPRRKLKDNSTESRTP
jgi:hypothetical protein